MTETPKASSRPQNIPIEAIVHALPIGIAFVDANKRIVLMNDAFYRSLDLPPGRFPAGTPVEDAVRASALRGVYGPGDPEAQVTAIMEADRTRPGRLRRRTYRGRSFDLINTPLPDGGYIVSAIDTTALLVARSEAENALTQTTSALATLRIGLAAFRPNGQLLFSNPRFAELLGIPTDRVVAGIAFSDLLDVLEDRDEFAGADGVAFLNAQRSANRGASFSMRRILATGQVVDVFSDPLPDGGWTITLADVSRLAQVEDEAQRRARLLDSILEAVPHGICVYGADQRVALINPAYVRVMGGAPVAVGESLEDIIRRRAENGEYGKGAVAEVYAREKGHDLTKHQVRRRLRPNGVAIDVRTAPLPDGGHISVVTDITALVQAEAQITRRADEMAVMLASIPHGIVLWDADRRLIASNTAAAVLTGHPPELMTPGRRDVEFIEKMVERRELGEQTESIARALLTRDQDAPHGGRYVRDNGRVLDVRSNPIPGGGWVSTYTDVTEIRETEDALRQAKEAAETASQAKSRFLTTMSHELRTPLNAVIGFSDALLRQAANPIATEVAEFAQQINDAGRQLLGLINIILDVARIESGRFDLASDRVETQRLVRTVLRQLDSAAQAGEIAVQVDLPDDLPALRCDEKRLTQALTQLVSNAIKFTDAGGSVTIKARLEPNGELAISVSDTGIGIPETELDRVFEPFIQLDSSLSRRYQGAGLGLYIARAMVLGHGGSIRLGRNPDHGTTAEILIPADRLEG
jgi:signal transduction histidine kinase